MGRLTLDALKKGFEIQDKSVLAQALTMAESRRADDQEIIGEFLKIVPKHIAKRIGISGTPGVGKSTFIESFGLFLINKSEKIAVLAVDPTSLRSGGSILGDKTRMNKLSMREEAFIRPSPSGTTLGGVAHKTREAILLCEAFGFDTIIVETVGIGQSEVSISKMVDYFVLLLQPASGDDLQGIKRGVLEVCQLVAVNKADGDLLNKAKLAQSEYRNALHIMRSQDEYQPQVVLTSALELKGLDDVDKAINDFYLKFEDKIEENRRGQFVSWLEDLLLEKFKLQLNAAKNDLLIEVNKSNNVIDIVDKVYQRLVKDD